MLLLFLKEIKGTMSVLAWQLFASRIQCWLFVQERSGFTFSYLIYSFSVLGKILPSHWESSYELSEDIQHKGQRKVEAKGLYGLGRRMDLKDWLGIGTAPWFQRLLYIYLAMWPYYIWLTELCLGFHICRNKGISTYLPDAVWGLISY